jgi:hypothetical protein
MFKSSPTDLPDNTSTAAAYPGAAMSMGELEFTDVVEICPCDAFDDAAGLSVFWFRGSEENE